MGSVSPKVLVAFSLWAIAALYCLPARAQETTTQDRQAAAEFDFFQQPAYQKVMTDCAYKAVTPPDFPSGQRVTPAMFKITPDKFQIIRNCMDEKGFPVPDGQKYARKGSDIQNAVPQAAQQSPPADVPQVT